MAPSFPFTPSGKRDIKTEQAFQNLNLAYCELASFSMLSSTQSSTEGNKKGKTSRLPLRTSEVKQYVLDMLSGSTADVPLTMSSAAYLSMLPTLWTLIIHPTPGGSDIVLHAALAHATGVSSKSASKKPATEFIARLVMVRLVNLMLAPSY